MDGAPGGERAIDDGFDRADSSDGRGARRTTFLLRSVDRRSEGSEKGGLRMPSLGVIINFWFSAGMPSSAWILIERSTTVESGENSSVWAVPWWVNESGRCSGCEGLGAGVGMEGTSTSAMMEKQKDRCL